MSGLRAFLSSQYGRARFIPVACEPSGAPTIVVKEEEEEGVHDGDEDAAPERDSETGVARVSPAEGQGSGNRPPPPPLHLPRQETVESGLLGAGTHVALGS